MDTITLVAALLHDTVEDTGYSLEQLRADFGEEVAHLVDGVTKLDKVELGNAAEAETIRKMVVAMARDPRVLVIKLSRPAAQHAHDALPVAGEAGEEGARDPRGARPARAPAGHGHGQVGAGGPVLRDPAPEEVLRDRPAGRDPGPVPRHLPQAGHRRGHPAARLRADHRDGRGPAQALLLDLPQDDRQGPRLRRHPRPRRGPGARRRGARLLRRDGHGARAVAADARPVQGLHRAAAVRGLPVAAHHGDRARTASRSRCRSAPTRCTAPPSTASRRTGATRRRAAAPRRGQAVEVDEMAWMRQLLDWQREAADPGDFLESLRFDLAAKEIFVFTPEGRRDHAADRGRRRSTWPTPCTPRSGTGASARGSTAGWSRWSGSWSPATSSRSSPPRPRRPGPSRDWLAFVASPRAKTKIKHWFAKERREEAIEAGKDAITREARRTGMPLQRLVSADAMAALARELHFPDLSGLYAAVGEGHVSRPARRAAAGRAARRGRGRRGGARRAGHPVDGPPAQVRGRRRGGGARRRRPDRRALHQARPLLHARARRRHPRLRHPRRRRSACTAPTAPTPATCRRAPSGWSTCAWSVSPGSVFLVAIQVEALDRHRLLSDVTKVLADEKVNILSASVHDLARPGGGVPVHLRDGRPQAPRAPAAGGAQRRGRLRRVPGDVGDLTARLPTTAAPRSP